MSSGPRIDTASGGVRLTRAELAHVVGMPDEEGAVVDHDVRVALEPVVHTIRNARARGLLRRWCGRREPVTEVIVGDTGVVVLTGGGHPDDVQEPRWTPRPTAVARTLAALLDLPPQPGPPPLDGSARWSSLVARACDPDERFGLADLRWAHAADTEPASVLVVAWHRDGGIVELRPADDGMVDPRPVHPLDLWTGLTTLAAPT